MDRKNVRCHDEIKRSQIIDNVLSRYHYDEKRGKVLRKDGSQLKGCVDSLGYQKTGLRIDKEKIFLRLHQIVWILNFGGYPKLIDHINGDKSDNRIENLREASLSENRCNSCYPWEPNEKTGLPSVFQMADGRYRAWLNNSLFYGSDKYELFNRVTLLGKNYQPDAV